MIAENLKISPQAAQILVRDLGPTCARSPDASATVLGPLVEQPSGVPRHGPIPFGIANAFPDHSNRVCAAQICVARDLSPLRPGRMTAPPPDRDVETLSTGHRRQNLVSNGASPDATTRTFGMRSDPRQTDVSLPSVYIGSGQRV